VITLALGQLKQWIGQGSLPANFQISVNCSEAFLRHEGSPRFIANALSGAGLKPENLMVELNEYIALDHSTVLEELHQLGVAIVVDDFGFSNSNIDQLITGGIGVVKIDQRWVRRSSSVDNETSQTVLRHLVSLCDSLDLEVVAEGIETTADYAAMQELGVDHFQGYLFAAPLTAEQFETSILGVPGRPDRAPESVG